MGSLGINQPDPDPATRAAITKVLEVDSDGELDRILAGDVVELFAENGKSLRKLKCVKFLGEGGRGAVFQCREAFPSFRTVLCKKLALKVALPGHDDSVRDEAEIHRKLWSQLAKRGKRGAKTAMPRFHDSGRIKVGNRPAGHQAILMELVPGSTVDKLLDLSKADREQGAEVNIARWLRVTASVLESLGHIDDAHGREFGGCGEHGDLKDSNVLVRSFSLEGKAAPTATIIDLGAWSNIRDKQREGTPGVHRDDLKATGAMLKRMLAPWDGVARALRSPNINDAIDVSAKLLQEDGFTTKTSAVGGLREVADRLAPPKRMSARRTLTIFAVTAASFVLVVGSWNIYEAEQCDSALTERLEAFHRARDAQQRLKAAEALVYSASELEESVGLVLGPLWRTGVVDVAVGIRTQKEAHGIRVGAETFVAVARAAQALAECPELGSSADQAWDRALSMCTQPSVTLSPDPVWMEVANLRNTIKEDDELRRALEQYSITLQSANTSPDGSMPSFAPPEDLGLASARAHSAPDGSPRAHAPSRAVDHIKEWCIRSGRVGGAHKSAGDWEKLKNQLGEAVDHAKRLRNTGLGLQQLEQLSDAAMILAEALKDADRAEKSLREWSPPTQQPPQVHLPLSDRPPPVVCEEFETDLRGVAIRHQEIRTRATLLTQASQSAATPQALDCWKQCAGFNDYAKEQVTAIEAEVVRTLETINEATDAARQCLLKIGPLSSLPGSDVELGSLEDQARSDRQKLEAALKIPARCGSDEGVKAACDAAQPVLTGLALVLEVMPALREVARLDVEQRTWTPESKSQPAEPRVVISPAPDPGPRAEVLGEIAKKQIERKTRATLLAEAAKSAATPQALDCWKQCAGFNDYAKEQVTAIEAEVVRTLETIKKATDEAEKYLGQELQLDTSEGSIQDLIATERRAVDVQQGLMGSTQRSPQVSQEAGVSSAVAASTAISLKVALTQALACSLRQIAEQRPFASVTAPTLTDPVVASRLESALHEAMIRWIGARLNSEVPQSELEERQRDIKALEGWQPDRIQSLARSAKLELSLAAEVCRSVGSVGEGWPKVEFRTPSAKCVEWLDVLEQSNKDLVRAEKGTSTKATAKLLAELRQEWKNDRNKFIAKIDSRFGGEARSAGHPEFEANSKAWAEWLEALRDRADSLEIWDGSPEGRAHVREVLSNAAEKAWNAQLDVWWGQMKNGWAFWCREGAAEWGMTLGEFRELALAWQAHAGRRSEKQREAVALAIQSSQKFDVRLLSCKPTILASEFQGNPLAKFDDLRIEGGAFELASSIHQPIGRLRVDDESELFSLAASWVRGEYDPPNSWGWGVTLTDFNDPKLRKGATSLQLAKLRPGHPYSVFLSLGKDVSAVEIRVVFRIGPDPRRVGSMRPETLFESTGDFEAPSRGTSKR